MDGAIPMEHFYVDDTIHGELTHYTFPEDDLKHMLSEAARSLSNPRRLRPKQAWITKAIADAIRERDDAASRRLWQQRAVG